ncbi:MAG: hypothetical protein ACE37H_04285 [Phycisphaeraceae bacterium]
MQDASQRYAHQTYTLRRKVFSFPGQKFHLYDPQGDLVLFAKLKAFKIKEDIRIYADDSQSKELLSIRTQSIFDIAGTYDVRDSVTNETVGALRRKGLKSMLRDEWLILDRNGVEVGKIVEDSQIKALVRRFIDAASMFMPQKFHAEFEGQTVATFQQNFNPFVQKITIDFTPDTAGKLDPRLGLAAAVLLCAIEGRQN